MALRHLQHSTYLLKGFTSYLAHVVFQVRNQDFGDKVTAWLAKGGNAILEGSSQQDKISPQGQRPQNIKARTNTAVEQYSRSAFDHLHNSREGIDNSGGAIKLATTVIAHLNAIDSDGDGLFRIGRMQKSFDHQRSFPKITYLFQVFPRQ